MPSSTHVSSSGNSLVTELKSVHFRYRQERFFRILQSTQRDCIASINKLIAMERERHDLLISHLVKTERGIPRLPETPEENTTYYEVAKQWVSCNSIMREVDLLLQQKRAQKISDKAKELNEIIHRGKIEAKKLLVDNTELQIELLTLYGEIKEVLDIVLAA